jgi:hypothetical protein
MEQEDDKYRHFTIFKVNDKEMEMGEAKISKKSGSPLDAAKKLFGSICEHEGYKKDDRLKFSAVFYIRETTRGHKTYDKIYGPYIGKFVKYETPLIIKRKDGTTTEYTMYPDVRIFN